MDQPQMNSPPSLEGDVKTHAQASPVIVLAVAAVFEVAEDAGASCMLACKDFRRCRPQATAGWDARVDRFEDALASCAFVRVLPSQAAQATFALLGPYRIEGAQAGGWLLLPADVDNAAYWLPLVPKVRRLDSDGHILEERVAELRGLDSSPGQLRAAFEVPAGFCLDVVVWRFDANSPQIPDELQHLLTLETQPLFMWSSHTNYSRPADVYAHLVFGHVYENHTVWPRYWKVCSELDAWALYVALSGLQLATGKRFYDLLRRQVVYSVIERQSADGAWRHGEWTEGMEVHYRLHAAAIHLLCAAVEAAADPAVETALRKAVNHVAQRAVKLEPGAWFPHDSLEADSESIKQLPFKWARSTALGKPESSMLVLNTHLDTTIAVDRYAEVTGDTRYAELVRSARATAAVVLGLRPAEWLYRPLFWAIYLTFLPTAQGRALPLHLRAVKRVAWRYLIPQLHRVRSRFPRFVMPGGFVDRDLSQQGCSVRYQPVNLMDLARFERRFGGCTALIHEALAFSRASGLVQRWKDKPGAEDDSLGFWSEALFHWCLQDQDPKYRAWLAEAVIDLSDNGLGLSPSLLGASPEASKPATQVGCLSPTSARIPIVNLSRDGGIELLAINTTSKSIDLIWETPEPRFLSWSVMGQSRDDDLAVPPTIPARGWASGVALTLPTH